MRWDIFIAMPHFIKVAFIYSIIHVRYSQALSQNVFYIRSITPEIQINKTS